MKSNEQSAIQMTAVYACVRILSESIAGLSVHIYKYTDSRIFRIHHCTLHMFLDSKQTVSTCAGPGERLSTISLFDFWIALYNISLSCHPEKLSLHIRIPSADRGRIRHHVCGKKCSFNRKMLFCCRTWIPLIIWIPNFNPSSCT